MNSIPIFNKNSHPLFISSLVEIPKMQKPPSLAVWRDLWKTGR